MATDSRSDRELQVTAALAAQRRDELVELGRHGLAEAFAFLAAEAADTLVERRQLRHAVEDSMGVSTPLPVEAEPQDLERVRRLAQAVQDLDNGKASPATTVVRCRAGHRTSIAVWSTCAGFLLVAEAPLPHRRSSEPRSEGRPVAMLVHRDGGTVDIGCTRCRHACRLDLGEVDRAVKAGATLVLAS